MMVGWEGEKDRTSKKRKVERETEEWIKRRKKCRKIWDVGGEGW